jgi:hypothetical protein
MRRFLGFLILSGVKTISWLFYKGKFDWPQGKPENPWQDIRLMVFLNHTSLYEPLFIQVLPYRYLWYLAGHFNIPGADVTLKRPIVGTFWKLMVPNIASISRKLDTTWETYLESIKKSDVVMIAPEGRMKRPNGLDKFGKRMTVRAGIADIIESMEDGVMLLCLSGGLHHVQSPGEHFPKLFKTISMNLVRLDIKEYKSQFTGSARERKLSIIHDLQRRLENDCPINSSNK